MENAEQYLKDLNDTIDDAHDRISKLEAKSSFYNMALAGIGLAAGGSLFISFKTAAAVRDLVKGIEPMGMAVQALMEQSRNAAQAAPAQNQDMPPPAEGPASEPAEWVKEANMNSSARQIMEDADDAWGNES